MSIRIPLVHDFFLCILIEENIFLFPVYSPVHRRRFAHDVDGFGMKVVDDTAAPFNQSFGSQHISPPPTESPNEGDSGLYSPSKVNYMFL